MHEPSRPPKKSSVPWLVCAHRMVRPATVMEPLQVYEVFRFAAPESSAAEAVMTLNTEPG